LERHDPNLARKKEGYLPRLYHALRVTLASIQKKIDRGEIDPKTFLETFVYLGRFPSTASYETMIRTLPRTRPKDRPLRVGFLPITGNPINWGHILIAFIAMDALNLDTVVFRVQGEIKYKNVPESDKVPPEQRHWLTMEVLREFFPLFRYTDIGRFDDHMGEEGQFEFANRLNTRDAIDFFYIMGSETEQRVITHRDLLYRMRKQHGLPKKHRLNWVLMQRGELGRTLTQGRADEIMRAGAQAEGLAEPFPVHVLRRQELNRDVDLNIASTYYREGGDESTIPAKVHQFGLANQYWGNRLGPDGEIVTREEALREDLRPVAAEIADVIERDMKKKRKQSKMPLGEYDFDGPSGSGKTTVAEEVAKILEARGYKVWSVGDDLALKPHWWRKKIEQYVTGEKRDPSGLYRSGFFYEEHSFFRGRVIARLDRAVARFRGSDRRKIVHWIPNAYVRDEEERRKMVGRAYPVRLEKMPDKPTVILREGKYRQYFRQLGHEEGKISDRVLSFRIKDEPGRNVALFQKRARKLRPEDEPRKIVFYERALQPSYEAYAARTAHQIGYEIDLTRERFQLVPQVAGLAREYGLLDPNPYAYTFQELDLRSWTDRKLTPGMLSFKFEAYRKIRELARETGYKVANAVGEITAGDLGFWAEELLRGRSARSIHAEFARRARTQAEDIRRMQARGRREGVVTDKMEIWARVKAYGLVQAHEYAHTFTEGDVSWYATQFMTREELESEFRAKQIVRDLAQKTKYRLADRSGHLAPGLLSYWAESIRQGRMTEQRVEQTFLKRKRNATLGLSISAWLQARHQQAPLPGAGTAGLAPAVRASELLARAVREHLGRDTRPTVAALTRLTLPAVRGIPGLSASTVRWLVERLAEEGLTLTARSLGQGPEDAEAFSEERFHELTREILDEKAWRTRTDKKWQRLQKEHFLYLIHALETGEAATNEQRARRRVAFDFAVALQGTVTARTGTPTGFSLRPKRAGGPLSQTEARRLLEQALPMTMELYTKKTMRLLAAKNHPKWDVLRIAAMYVRRLADLNAIGAGLAPARKLGAIPAMSEEDSPAARLALLREELIAGNTGEGVTSVPGEGDIQFFEKKEPRLEQPGPQFFIRPVLAARQAGMDPVSRSFPEFARALARNFITGVDYLLPHHGNPPALVVHLAEPVTDPYTGKSYKAIPVAVLHEPLPEGIPSEGEDESRYFEFEEDKVRSYAFDAAGTAPEEAWRRREELLKLALEGKLFPRTVFSILTAEQARRLAVLMGRTEEEKRALEKTLLVDIATASVALGTVHEEATEAQRKEITKEFEKRKRMSLFFEKLGAREAADRKEAAQRREVLDREGVLRLAAEDLYLPLVRVLIASSADGSEWLFRMREFGPLVRELEKRSAVLLEVLPEIRKITGGLSETERALFIGELAQRIFSAILPKKGVAAAEIASWRGTLAGLTRALAVPQLDISTLPSLAGSAPDAAGEPLRKHLEQEIRRHERAIRDGLTSGLQEAEHEAMSRSLAALEDGDRRYTDLGPSWPEIKLDTREEFEAGVQALRLAVTSPGRGGGITDPERYRKLVELRRMGEAGEWEHLIAESLEVLSTVRDPEAASVRIFRREVAAHLAREVKALQKEIETHLTADATDRKVGGRQRIDLIKEAQEKIRALEAHVRLLEGQTEAAGEVVVSLHLSAAEIREWVEMGVDEGDLGPAIQQVANHLESIDAETPGGLLAWYETLVREYVSQLENRVAVKRETGESSSVGPTIREALRSARPYPDLVARLEKLAEEVGKIQTLEQEHQRMLKIDRRRQTEEAILALEPANKKVLDARLRRIEVHVTKLEQDVANGDVADMDTFTEAVRRIEGLIAAELSVFSEKMVRVERTKFIGRVGTIIEKVGKAPKHEPAREQPAVEAPVPPAPAAGKGEEFPASFLADEAKQAQQVLDQIAGEEERGEMPGYRRPKRREPGWLMMMIKNLLEVIASAADPHKGFDLAAFQAQSKVFNDAVTRLMQTEKSWSRQGFPPWADKASAIQAAVNRKLKALSAQSLGGQQELPVVLTQALGLIYVESETGKAGPANSARLRSLWSKLTTGEIAIKTFEGTGASVATEGGVPIVKVGMQGLDTPEKAAQLLVRAAMQHERHGQEDRKTIDEEAVALIQKTRFAERKPATKPVPPAAKPLPPLVTQALALIQDNAQKMNLEPPHGDRLKRVATILGRQVVIETFDGTGIRLEKGALRSRILLGDKSLTSVDQARRLLLIGGLAAGLEPKGRTPEVLIETATRIVEPMVVGIIEQEFVTEAGGPSRVEMEAAFDEGRQMAKEEAAKQPQPVKQPEIDPMMIAKLQHHFEMNAGDLDDAWYPFAIEMTQALRSASHDERVAYLAGFINTIYHVLARNKVSEDITEDTREVFFQSMRNFFNSPSPGLAGDESLRGRVIGALQQIERFPEPVMTLLRQERFFQPLIERLGKFVISPDLTEERRGRLEKMAGASGRALAGRQALQALTAAGGGVLPLLEGKVQGGHLLALAGPKGEAKGVASEAGGEAIERVVVNLPWVDPDDPGQALYRVGTIPDEFRTAFKAGLAAKPHPSLAELAPRHLPSVEREMTRALSRQDKMTQEGVDELSEFLKYLHNLVSQDGPIQKDWAHYAAATHQIDPKSAKGLNRKQAEELHATLFLGQVLYAYVQSHPDAHDTIVGKLEFLGKAHNDAQGRTYKHPVFHAVREYLREFTKQIEEAEATKGRAKEARAAEARATREQRKAAAQREERERLGIPEPMPAADLPPIPLAGEPSAEAVQAGAVGYDGLIARLVSLRLEGPYEVSVLNSSLVHGQAVMVHLMTGEPLDPAVPPKNYVTRINPRYNPEDPRTRFGPKIDYDDAESAFLRDVHPDKQRKFSEAENEFIGFVKEVLHLASDGEGWMRGEFGSKLAGIRAKVLETHPDLAAAAVTPAELLAGIRELKEAVAGVNARLDTFEGRLADVERRLGELDERVGKVEAGQAAEGAVPEASTPAELMARLAALTGEWRISTWRDVFGALRDDAAANRGAYEDVTLSFDPAQPGLAPLTVSIPKGLEENVLSGVVLKYLATAVNNRFMSRGIRRVRVRTEIPGFAAKLRARFDALFNQAQDPAQQVSGFARGYHGNDLEIVEEKGASLGTGGEPAPPSRETRVQPAANVLTINMGLQKVKYGVASLDRNGKFTGFTQGPFEFYTEEALGTGEDARTFLDKIIAKIQSQVENWYGVDRISVGVSAPVRDERVLKVKIGNQKRFSDQGLELMADLGKYLSNAFGAKPTSVANDGDLEALGLARTKGYRNTLVLKFGTSLAGGIIDGQGRIAGGLNEITGVVIDMREDASQHPTTLVRGNAGGYVSFGGIVRLAGRLGLDRAEWLKGEPDLPRRLALELENAGSAHHAEAKAVYEGIGEYVADLALELSGYYPVDQVVISGGVVARRAGLVIAEKARALVGRTVEFYRDEDEITRRYGALIGAAELAGEAIESGKSLGGPDQAAAGRKFYQAEEIGGGMETELGEKAVRLARFRKHLQDKGIEARIPPFFVIPSRDAREIAQEGTRPFAGPARQELDRNLSLIGREAGETFGDPEHPLFVSVRASAPQMTPGQFLTVLNIGINDATLPALARRVGDMVLAQNLYARLIERFLVEVYGHSEKDIAEDLRKAGIPSQRPDLRLEVMQALFMQYRNEAFPQDPHEQLRRALDAIQHTARYSTPERSEFEGGIVVQRMVFGVGANSFAGEVASRDPETGAEKMRGNIEPGVQGDMTTGRTRVDADFFGQAPGATAYLRRILEEGEAFFKDGVKVEVTIENGIPHLLQIRIAERTNRAQAAIITDLFLRKRLITEGEAVRRGELVNAKDLRHDFRLAGTEKLRKIGKGTLVAPGVAVGRVAVTSGAPYEFRSAAEPEKRIPYILVKAEIRAHDAEAIRDSEGAVSLYQIGNHAESMALQAGVPAVLDIPFKRIDPDEGIVIFVDEEGREIALRETDPESVISIASDGTIYLGKAEVVSTKRHLTPDEAEFLGFMIKAKGGKPLYRVRAGEFQEEKLVEEDEFLRLKTAHSYPTLGPRKWTPTLKAVLDVIEQEEAAKIHEQRQIPPEVIEEAAQDVARRSNDDFTHELWTKYNGLDLMAYNRAEGTSLSRKPEYVVYTNEQDAQIRFITRVLELADDEFVRSFYQSEWGSGHHMGGFTFRYGIVTYLDRNIATRFITKLAVKGMDGGFRTNDYLFPRSFAELIKANPAFAKELIRKATEPAEVVPVIESMYDDPHDSAQRERWLRHRERLFGLNREGNLAVYERRTDDVVEGRILARGSEEFSRTLRNLLVGWMVEALYELYEHRRLREQTRDEHLPTTEELRAFLKEAVLDEGLDLRLLKMAQHPTAPYERVDVLDIERRNRIVRWIETGQIPAESGESLGRSAGSAQPIRQGRQVRAATRGLFRPARRVADALREEGRYLPWVEWINRNYAGGVIGAWEVPEVRAYFFRRYFGAQEARARRVAAGRDEAQRLHAAYAQGLASGIYGAAHAEGKFLSVLATSSDQMSPQGIARQLEINPGAFAVLVYTGSDQGYESFHDSLRTELGASLGKVVIDRTSPSRPRSVVFEELLSGKSPAWKLLFATVKKLYHPGLTREDLLSHLALFAAKSDIEGLSSSQAVKLIVPGEEEWEGLGDDFEGLDVREALNLYGNTMGFLLARRAGNLHALIREVPEAEGSLSAAGGLQVYRFNSYGLRQRMSELARDFQGFAEVLKAA
jgi:predicted NBD/HSP70 family sugar kinase